MRIKLLYQYIAHDVKQLTLRYANARIESPEISDMAAFGENDSDDQLLRRWTVTGTARLRHILREYLVKKNEDADDTLTNKESWGFTFPDDIADSHGTAELMHWFIVKWCLWQWCQAFSPSDASIALDEIKDLEDDLVNNFADSEMPMKERRCTHEDKLDDEIIVTYEPA